MNETNLKFSVLVPAYNEAANIGSLLESVVGQRLSMGELKEIVVVASGCTDGTEEIVRSWMKRDRRIRILRQKERKGKAAAINYFLKKTKNKIVVMAGGDVRLQQGCLERLVSHFKKKGTGMVGARIKSVNSNSSFLGFSNNLIWRLHDRMARDYPRLGEVTAWRRVFEKLPRGTICDEAEIEMMVKDRGLRLVYEPRAVVYNRGPEKMGEFLMRRRSIHLGHLLIRKRWGSKVESEKGWLILRYLLKELNKDWKHWRWYSGLVLVEVITKLMARFDYYIGRHEVIWPVAKSSKQAIEVR